MAPARTRSSATSIPQVPKRPWMLGQRRDRAARTQRTSWSLIPLGSRTSAGGARATRSTWRGAKRRRRSSGTRGPAGPDRDTLSARTPSGSPSTGTRSRAPMSGGMGSDMAAAGSDPVVGQFHPGAIGVEGPHPGRQVVGVDVRGVDEPQQFPAHLGGGLQHAVLAGPEDGGLLLLGDLLEHGQYVALVDLTEAVAQLVEDENPPARLAAGQTGSPTPPPR